MPMFLCDRCDAADNTALGEYWHKVPGKRLCTECATGTWHAKFPRQFGEAAVQAIGREHFRYFGRRLQPPAVS